MAEQSSADYRGNLGRYALYGEIAAGGMATVHLARLLAVGFARTVAIKRLHPHLAKDPDFVGMFLEEARLAARVTHPNVVATLDVVSDDSELFLVMEYVAGESLSRLVRKAREAGSRIPARYVLGIVCGALDGLHAAHDAKSEKGQPLGIVHRDISPQNIHVGIDGVARVLDFGIAKATNRVQETRTDQIKGKVAYMSPEQLAKGAIDRRADVYAASVLLWEALTGERLFKADDVPSLVYAIINEEVRPPSALVPDLPEGLDAIVLKGLAREADDRWSSAREMAEALEKVLSPAPPREIGEWVKTTAGEALAWRLDLVHQIESKTSSSLPPPLRLHSPANPIEVASGVVPSDSVPDDDARWAAPTVPYDSHKEKWRPQEPSEPETLAQPPSARTPAPSVTNELRFVHSSPGRAAMVGAGVLLIAGITAMVIRWMQWSNETNTAATEAPAVHPAPPPAAESAIVIGAQRATPTGAAGASTTTTTQPASPRFFPVSKPTAAPATGGAHDECENPFTVDARGIRHPKPQCFKK